MAIANTILIVAGAAALATAGTYLTPRHVHVERTQVMDTAPDAVIDILSSNTAYQSINPYKDADANLKIAFFGPEKGVGSGFSFDGKDGKGTQTVAKITANSVTYAIDLGPMGQPTQTVTVKPSAEGTVVTWSMDADMGLNPVARVIGLFMDGMVGKTFDQGLANLATAQA